MGRMSDLHLQMQEDLGTYLECGGSLYAQDKVIDEVLKRFISRADVGMVKYGTSMADNDGDTLYWINHAIEEAMDMVNYLTRVKQGIESKAPPLPSRMVADPPMLLANDKQLKLEV